MLWPLGLLFFVLAALPPVLARFQQRVLAAIMVRIGFLFTAIAVPGLFDTIIKRLIGRARPMVERQPRSVPASARSSGARITRACRPGMPRPPSPLLVAFGSAVAACAHVYVLIYALLIAISRVVVTAHYPTDVAAGALVGIVGALMVRRWFALRRLGFSFGPDGTVHQYPGPSLRSGSKRLPARCWLTKKPLACRRTEP